jgi:hypothetical protein
MSQKCQNANLSKRSKKLGSKRLIWSATESVVLLGHDPRSLFPSGASTILGIRTRKGPPRRTRSTLTRSLRHAAPLDYGRERSNGS